MLLSVETNLDKAIVELSKHPRMTSDTFYELNVNFDLTLCQLSTQTLHRYLSCSFPKTGVARSITENANPARHMGAYKTRDALANLE